MKRAQDQSTNDDGAGRPGRWTPLRIILWLNLFAALALFALNMNLLPYLPG